MNAIRITVGLLLGTALAVGCTDRNTPTSASSSPASFSANGGSGQTSVVIDPAGDASLNLKTNVGPGADAKVPDYLDVIQAAIAKQGKIFLFTLNMADIVPSNPAAASAGSTAAQVWIWGLDTDPGSFPEGGTFPPNQANGFEFFVDVEWDGAKFTGLLYDRRPLLNGDPVVVTPAQFTIDGALVSVSVAASLLGDPPTFAWDAGTLTRHSYGTEGFQILDHAPDAGLATWPQ